MKNKKRIPSLVASSLLICHSRFHVCLYPLHCTCDVNIIVCVFFSRNGNKVYEGDHRMFHGFIAFLLIFAPFNFIHILYDGTLLTATDAEINVINNIFSDDLLCQKQKHVELQV